MGVLVEYRLGQVLARLEKTSKTGSFAVRDGFFATKNEKTRPESGFLRQAGDQAAWLAATKSQFTRFQNASTYFGRRLR